MKPNLPHWKRTEPSRSGSSSAGKVPPASAGSGLTVSREEIAAGAEVLWRERGCPHDRDEEIWLEAERRLNADLRLRLERDRTAPVYTRLDFDEHGDGLMEELNERFPGASGKETTSL